MAEAAPFYRESLLPQPGSGWGVDGVFTGPPPPNAAMHRGVSSGRDVGATFPSPLPSP